MLPMNADVRDEGSTHVQGTSHDPSTSGAIVDKTGNKEMEGTIMDTQGGESLTTQSVPTVVEIPVADKDENVAHETSSIEHGGNSLEHEVSKSEPVAGDVDHEMEHEVKNSQNEVSSVEHEVSKVDHAVGNVDHEMEVGEHEVKKSQNEASSVEHEVSKVDHAVGNVDHEMEVGGHEISEPVLGSAELYTKHEVVNDTHTSTPHETEQT